MRADVGQCDLGCLDHQMEGGEIVNRVGADPEALENAERDQRRKALTVRRNFMDLGAERGLRDRADPIGLVPAEIIGMQRPAIRRCVRDHPLGEFAAVEVLAFAGDDAFERIGMARQGDALADRGGFPGRQERLGKARLGSRAARRRPSTTPPRSASPGNRRAHSGSPAPPAHPGQGCQNGARARSTPRRLPERLRCSNPSPAWRGARQSGPASRLGGRGRRR